jgi:hypothetical protein
VLDASHKVNELSLNRFLIRDLPAILQEVDCRRCQFITTTHILAVGGGRTKSYFEVDANGDSQMIEEVAELKASQLLSIAYGLCARQNLLSSTLGREVLLGACRHVASCSRMCRVRIELEEPHRHRCPHHSWREMHQSRMLSCHCS